jgi:spore germination protein KC
LKLKFSLTAIVLCFTLLTGCFDRKELNEIGIVLAVALDKNKYTNEIIVSCEVVRPSSLKKDGSNDRSSSEIVTGIGSTVFEAVRNISKKLDRKSFFSHNKIIIISESLAKDGVSPILDVFVRDPEIRLSVWLVIAKNTEARQLLSTGEGLDKIHAFYLNDMIKTKWANSEVQVLNLLDFYKKLLKSGVNPTTGALEIVKQFNNINLTLTGTAVFKKDKLVGYLNDKETRGLNWVTDEVKSGIINVPGVANSDQLIAINIKRSNSNIIPKVVDNKVSFVIEVKEFGNIGEVQDTSDFLDLKLLSKIEDEQEKAIEKEIKASIERAKELHSDIFGFGNTLSRYYPKEWEQKKDNWDTLFTELQYEINVKVNLRRSGQMLRPFAPKE